LVEDKENKLLLEVLNLLKLLSNKYNFSEFINQTFDFHIIIIYIESFYFQNIWNLETLSANLESLENLLKKEILCTQGNVFSV